MAKPKDSKFNRRYSTVDSLPKDGPKFHDFAEGREQRKCAVCGGEKQENHEHLRFFHGKFRCKQCRTDHLAKQPICRNDEETSSNRAGEV